MPRLRREVVAALGPEGADYLENAAVAVMLKAGPSGMTDPMAEAARRCTITKSAASTLAFVALTGLLSIAGWNWLRDQRERQGSGRSPIRWATMIR